MELVHCIYTSAATMTNFRISELDALLEKARLNNAKLEITGMLLYEDGSFFQVLEGDRTVVETLFEKIAKDTISNFWHYFNYGIFFKILRTHASGYPKKLGRSLVNCFDRGCGYWLNL